MLGGKRSRWGGELAYIVLTGVLMFSVSFGLQVVGDGGFKIASMNNVIFITLLSILISGAWPILRTSLQLEELFARNQSFFSRLLQKNEVQNRLMHTVLKAFEHNTHPAYEALTTSLANFLGTMRIEEDLILLRGDYLAQQLYENFWEQIIAAQQKARSEGAKPVRVFVTHSASVGLWTSPAFSGMREQQRQFCRIGGVLVRIFFHEYGSKEDSKEYAAIISEMRSEKIHAYYVDRNSEERALEFKHDYLMTCLNGKTFTNTWHATWESDALFGQVSGTEIWSRDYEFAHKFWPNWIDAVEILRKSKVDHLEDPILALRPDADMVDFLKTSLLSSAFTAPKAPKG